MRTRYLTLLATSLLFGLLVLGQRSPTTVSAENNGEISGTMTNIVGAPLAGIEVWLFTLNGGEWRFSTYDTTDADGTYALTGLEADNYRLHFRDWSGVYAYQYYDGVSRLSDATDIPVGNGETVTVDQSLPLAGRIAGTVTGVAGQPLDYGYVFLFEHETADPGSPLFVRQLTGINYNIGGLPTGDYIVQFSGSISGQYYNEYYQDRYDFAQADPVPVETGFTTTGIDGVLGEPISGQIAGVVRDERGSPLAGIEVSLYRYSTVGGWDLHAYLNSSADGGYSFAELLDGQYRLLFRDWSQNYAFEYYDGATTFAEATDIPLAAGETLIMPDVNLEEGGRIAGSLTAPDGSLLDYTYAFVFMAGPVRGDVLFMQTVTNGTYNIGGLPTGDYIVQFSGQQGPESYTEYWDDRPDFPSADAVPVIVGETTAGINAELGFAPGGTVRGAVTDPYGRAFDLTRVNAYQDSGGSWELVKSEVLPYYESDYELSLPAGTYRLEFEGESFLNPGNPISEVYDDVQSLDEGVDITVELGQTVRDIDARLGNFATASVSGRVTDNAGTPLAGIEVYAYDRSLGLLWDQVAVTDVAGNYTITGLWPESYFIEFYDPALTYAHEFYDDAAEPAAATQVLVTYDAVSNIDAALTAAPAGSLPGSIAGTITDESGAPLFGIRATVEDAGSGDFFAVGYAASDGSYRVRYVPAGSYTVRFSDPDGSYITEWFDDAGSEDEATPVEVTDSASTTAIDAVMEQGGKISGTVTNNMGGSFPILSVVAWQFDSAAGEWVQMAFTAGLNTTEYELVNLPEGAYRVSFSGQYYNGNGYTEFYDDAPTIDEGQEVPVIPGETTSGIDAILGPDILGAIGGSVTDGDGTPLENITVRLVDYDFGYIVAETTTGSDGGYLFENVTNGIYFVEFVDLAGVYPGEWYDDAPTAAFATPITVDDAPVAGIDAVLDGAGGDPGGGSISGLVTDEVSGEPLTGIEVRCYEADWDPVGDCDALTAADGSYLLGGFLPTGEYLVRFSAPDGSAATEYYDDVGRIDLATPISVTVGQDTPGIDAALTPAGYISGTLNGVDGEPLQVQSVAAWRLVSGDWVIVKSETWVDSDDPTYLLGGLPAGVYRLQFSGGSYFDPDRYVEYYDDVQLLAEGSDVPVVAGEVTPDINAVLGDLYDGAVSGVVTGASGNGLDFVRVTLYRDDGNWFRETQTDADGAYAIEQLPPGNYLVAFTDLRGLYVSEFYDDQPSLDMATPVIVGNSLVTGIDAALVLTGGISGLVTDLAGEPLDFVQVTALALRDGAWTPIADAFAEPDGSYLLAGLAPDSYRLEFLGYRLIPGEPPAMYLEYYDDQPTVGAGNDIVLAAGGLVSGIDAQLGNLAPNGAIQGAVMDMTGNGLAGIKVTVAWEDPLGNWVLLGEVWTDAAGNYLVEGVVDAAYRLCFSDPAGHLVAECYDDAAGMGQAEDIVVHDGATGEAILTWLAAENDPPVEPPPDPEPAHVIYLPVVR